MYAINALPKRDMGKSLTGCCPPFNPKDWDEQSFEFEDKLFVKVSTRSFLHIPLNMNGVMKRVMGSIEDAGAGNPHETLMLTDEKSPWQADHYIAVEKDVPDEETIHLNGTFIAKVFDGPFRDMPKWQSQLLTFAKYWGKLPLKTFFSYAMCPRCAKAYHHNYVIGFEQVI